MLGKNIMRMAFALLTISTMATASFAGEIKNGAIMQVKPSSIWFQKPSQLAHWQKLKKAGHAKALTQYQDNLLSEREAWQFDNPLMVKILKYEPGKRRVDVEMTSEGRMKGSTWSIDPDTLVPE